MRQHIRPSGTKVCRDCPFFISQSESKHGASWCIPTEVNWKEHDEGVDVLFVGTAPGKDEDAEGMVYVGATGTLFRSVIRSITESDKGFAYSNILRCVYGSKDWDKNPEIPRAARQCLKLLKSEIKRLNPKVIVPMGNHAYQTFFPNGENIGAVRGRVVTTEFAGKERTFVPSNQPAAALRNENLVSLLRSDIQKAINVAKWGLQDLPSARSMKPYRVVDTIPKLKKMIRKMAALGPEDFVAVDYETPNVNKRYSTHISTVQFAWSHDQAYVVPVSHPETPWSPKEIRKVLSALRYIFTNEKFQFKAWLAHNAKFEQLTTKAALDVWITNRPVYDTMALAFLMDENRVALKGYGPLTLKTLAKEILEFYDYTNREVLEVRINIDGSPIEEVYEYGCKDAVVTWRLLHYIMEYHIEPMIKPHIFPLLEHLYNMASAAFAAIEWNGFKVDMDHLRELRKSDSVIIGRMREIMTELYTMPAVLAANEQLVQTKIGNVRSPWGIVNKMFDPAKGEHLKILFFDILQLDPISWTKTTARLPLHLRVPATDKALFAEYKDSVPAAGLIAEWKGLQKLKTSYINQIYNFMKAGAVEDHIDGRIRPSVGVTETATGRTNQYKPNLQQIPGRGKAAKYIKNMFIVDDGRVLIQADYMTNEVRWLTIASGDPVFAKLFRDGLRLRNQFRGNPSKELATRIENEADIHRQVASSFFNIDIDEVRKDIERYQAKSIIFGAMFGRGVPSISRQIGVDYKEGAKLISALWARFPKAYEWLMSQPTFAQEHGFVFSPIHRPRRLPAFWTGNEQLRARAGRLAQNAPVQGVASDATVIGCGLFAKWHWEHPEYDWRLINMVHDSFMLDVPIEDMIPAVHLMEKTFTTDVMEYMTEHFGVDFNCPLEIDFEIGTKWGELQKWDFDPAELTRIQQDLLMAA